MLHGQTQIKFTKPQPRNTACLLSYLRNLNVYIFKRKNFVVALMVDFDNLVVRGNRVFGRNPVRPQTLSEETLASFLTRNI
jgi:hypothetical protein